VAIILELVILKVKTQSTLSACANVKTKGKGQ